MIKTLILINPIKDNNNLKRERCKPQYWRQLLASKNSGTQFKQPCMHHCTSCSTGRQMQIQAFSRPAPFPHISVSPFNHNRLSPQFLMSKSIYYKNRKKWKSQINVKKGCISYKLSMLIISLMRYQYNTQQQQITKLTDAKVANI